MPFRVGMSITVLLADDSAIMREAIKRLLEDESRIQVVGEAANFAVTMQMIADVKPHVLLLDLHMPLKQEFPASLVKSQLNSVKHTLAISFANDEEARALAESYGAVTLLDKMSLYSTLVPAIMKLAEPSARSSYSPDTKAGREAHGPLELPE